MITLELLYYEIHTRNRLHSTGFRSSRKEKLCIVYLGWCEMNGLPVTLIDLKKRKFGSVIQKLIREGAIDHRFRPVKDGRIFFYKICHEVCLFKIKNMDLEYEGLEVDINEVNKIINPI